MKSKTLLLSLFFAFAVVGLKAQEATKYEYAYIQYIPNGIESIAGIWVEMSGKEREQIKVEKKDRFINQGNAVLSYTPLVEYLEKLSKDGWQVVSSDLTMGKYLLRRKNNHAIGLNTTVPVSLLNSARC